MFKLIILLKRKEGMTLEEFRDYYENKHIVLTRKLTPEMRRYTRNYITPYNTEMGAGGEPPFDSVTEVYFDTREAFDEQMRYLAENRNARPRWSRTSTICSTNRGSGISPPSRSKVEPRPVGQTRPIPLMPA